MERLRALAGAEYGTGPALSLGLFFLLFRPLRGSAQQPVNVGLGGQNRLHFLLGGGVLGIGFFLLGQQPGILGLQRLVGGEFLQTQLVKLGFIVLPYCQADPVLCKRLEEAGAATVMPLGAPIGTNKGLQTKEFLQIIIEQAGIPVVVDAGIGAPSHAAEAMELGASAVLVNTAIAVAGNPVEMALAFKAATEAGRRAYEAGLGLQADNFIAEASSPLTAFLE